MSKKFSINSRSDYSVFSSASEVKEKKYDHRLDEKDEIGLGYVALADGEEDEKPEVKKTTQPLFIQGSVNLFNESLEALENTVKGQQKKYGEPAQLQYIKDFFKQEKLNINSKGLSSSSKIKLNTFIEKYHREIKKLTPSPANFIDFFNRQKFEADQYFQVSGDDVLQQFVSREEDALDQAILDEEEKQRQKENSCWARIRRKAFQLAAGATVLASGWPLYLLIKSLVFTSDILDVDADYPILVANVANKDVEQDVFMHQTLICYGILLGTGMTAAVFGLLAIYNHRYVVIPLKSKMQELTRYFDQDRAIMQAIKDVLINIPVGLGATTHPMAPKKHHGNTRIRVIDEEKAAAQLANLSLDVAERATRRIIRPDSPPSSSYHFLTSSSSSSSSSLSGSSSSSSSSSSSDSSLASHIITISPL